MKLLTLVLNCDCDLVLKLSSSGMEQYHIRSLLGDSERGRRASQKRRRLFFGNGPCLLFLLFENL